MVLILMNLFITADNPYKHHLLFPKIIIKKNFLIHPYPTILFIFSYQCNFNFYKNNIVQMGPKKKSEPGAEDNAEKVEFLSNKVKALEYQIVWEQQRSDRSKTQEKNMRKAIVELDQQFDKQKQKLLEISNKMTEQYDATEIELKKKVDEKRKELQDKEAEIRRSKEVLKNTRAEYEEKLKQKQKELNDLKQKMEDMSIEFSRMLRETLQKMQERIELQQWDNESDPTLLKKMKDLSELYSG